MTEQNEPLTSGELSAAAGGSVYSKLRTGLAKTREQLAEGLGNLLLG